VGQATATLTAGGAVSYVWSSGQTSAAINESPAATTGYTVTGTDANGCVNTATATVTVNPLPVITVTNTGPYCVTATIQLDATGGTTYAWTGPNGFSSALSNPSIVGSTASDAGQYDVTVTDANGCVSTGSTTVVVNTALVPLLASNSPVCEQQQLDLTCANGVSWTWTGPNGFTSTNQNPSIAGASPAATGTYSISLTDANGCVGTGTIFAIVNPLPIVTVNSATICVTQATATLTASGAVTYSWDTGATTDNITDSPAATTSYTVTGTDANGCVNTATATITVNPLPVITVSNTGPYCVAATIQLDATGGTTYAWTGPNGFADPNSTAFIANAQATDAGTYSVTVTDANGCVSTGTTLVVVNTALIPILATNSPVCEQQQLDLTCANGVSWSWTGPNGFTDTNQNPSIANATPAAGGTYSLTLTDANGCIGTGTVSAVVNPLPVVTVSSSTICVTQATATLTANGAVNYSWTGSVTPNNAAVVTDSPLSTSVYTVTGTDANGCQDTAVSTITVNPLPNVTVNSTAICPTFTANLTAGGAVNYSWTAGVTPNNTAAVTATPATTTDYTVTGTDANGCTNTAVATVTVNAQLVVDAGVDDTVCIGNNINLNATGGPAGTNYVWSPGALPGASQTIVASATQTFTVLGTDPNGCQGSDSIVITVPAAITLATGGFPATCNGVCDGQVVVLASPTTGGFAQYTYAWTGGGTTAGVNGMCAGTYTVTVTNNAGCTAVDSSVVTEPTSVAASANGIAPASCNGSCDGTATINPNGGTPPYNYTWSSVGTGATPINLCANNYTCTVTDANGCSVPVTLTITEPTVILASVAPVSTICVGSSSTLTASASGGNGGYTYTWTAGTTPNNTATVTASPTLTTGYTVTVSDVNGCAPVVASVTVTVNPPLSVAASADVTICNGQTASMSANGSGGNGVYTYTWATGTLPANGTSVSATPSQTTTYTITLSDGCGTPPVIDTVVVNVNPLPVLTVTSDVASGCAPVCATFSVSSVPAVAIANWITTDGQIANNQAAPQFCFTTASTYGANVSVTDVNGCQSALTNNTLVVVHPVPTAAFDFNPQPATVANPIITFTDQSTGANITNWFWQFNNASDTTSTQQNPVFDFVDAGNYDVWLTVTSDNGCVDSINHTVVIDPEFIIYVPNAFSPNDDGINDTFFPKGLGIDVEEYQMWIYDRWGNMIWANDDFFKGWDGKVQGHDEIVQQDVYVWKIKLKTWSGEKKSYVGHVTVVK
jgi:gliding motility-associated-like protein